MANDLLVSWHEGAAKRAIVDFVARVTKESAPDFVPPEARVAVFDRRAAHSHQTDQGAQILAYAARRP